jgi:nitrite reductase (NADH) small subunit
MTVHNVGRKSEIKELQPKIVTVNKLPIAVYRLRDQFYAYLDNCPHQGGPPCEGQIRRNVECEVGPGGRRLREYLSNEKYSLLCPWHGLDYDIETGICRSNKKYRLRSYRVIEDGDDLLIEI